jgi:hypothetical protein
VINYRDLLKKYMAHVWDCEGINYIDSLSYGEGFTEVEKDVLNILAREVGNHV